MLMIDGGRATLELTREQLRVLAFACSAAQDAALDDPNEGEATHALVRAMAGLCRLGVALVDADSARKPDASSGALQALRRDAA